MLNIYVGNLSFNATEDELEQLFAEFGQVAKSAIITDRQTGRSRGFGFVEMSQDEEGRKAIEELNGQQVQGRVLTVNEARPRPPRGDGGDGGRGYSNPHQD